MILDQEDIKNAGICCTSARGLFMRFGIKSLTMEDIARQLSISKKTLYKYVRDKNELVRKAMKIQFEEESKTIDQIIELDLNAIDEQQEISRYVVSILKDLHPSIHYDLEKYHNSVWLESMTARQNKIYECICNNLRKGIKEGVYRKDLNIDVIAKIYISRIDIVFDGKLFPSNEISFPEVYMEMFRYHIRGIASEKGKEYLVAKVKHERIKQI